MTRAPERLLRSTFDHPEGLVWDCRNRKLLWVDIFKGQIVCCEVSSGHTETVDVGQVVGCVAPRRSGGLVCAVRDGFAFLDQCNALHPISPAVHHSANLQMNDGAVDARGRFWAGSTTSDAVKHPGVGSLYRLDADGSVSTQLRGVSVSNGIGWSPDSKRCYHVDSVTHRIDSYDFDLDSGTLRGRVTFATVESLPDGLAVDVDGCVWVALFRGWAVHRFTPSGVLDRVIGLPGSLVTTCAFGGDDMSTLFIAVSRHGLSDETAASEEAGSIFAVDAGVQGLASHEFLG